MLILTGGTGQLGQELQKRDTFFAPYHYDFDVYNPDLYWLGKHIPFEKITGIVHAAADTHVGDIELKNPVTRNSVSVNVLGTLNMAELANLLKVPLFHISTETCINPYNVYARTKLLAEDMASRAKQHVIIRTSFRDRPFEYPEAIQDMYTIGDYVDVIAGILVKRFQEPASNKIEYIGTGAKTVYELAKESRPDVIPTTIEMVNAKLSTKLKPMTELLEVKCWQP